MIEKVATTDNRTSSYTYVSKRRLNGINYSKPLYILPAVVIIARSPMQLRGRYGRVGGQCVVRRTCLFGKNASSQKEDHEDHLCNSLFLVCVRRYREISN